MVKQRRPAVTDDSVSEQEMRNQEVLRANRELAAYFKGRRTEREARAALKIIKAFVRDRERRKAGSRPPLPGFDEAKTPKAAANRKAARDTVPRHRPKRRRKARDRPRKDVAASTTPETNEEPPSPAV